jgi:HNH endonuclease
MNRRALFPELQRLLYKPLSDPPPRACRLGIGRRGRRKGDHQKSIQFPWLRGSAGADGFFPVLFTPGIRRSGSSRPSLNQRAWKKKAAWVKQRDGHRCTECGETEGLVCHHIVRPQDGGTDESSNLTTLCRRCHGNAHLKRREESRGRFF